MPCSEITAGVEAALSRHERVAVQLSGGRDSIACLYLLRSFLDRVTVYWCNTGNAYPETMSAISTLKEMCPSFIEVAGNQPDVVSAFGLPTDILPVNATPIGRLAGGNMTPMQDRYSCCARTKFFPLHERMIQDGITLIIRGQRKSDDLKSPIKSGEVHDGIEYLFPIEQWTTKSVMSYLNQEGAPIPRFYEMLETSPDCLSCSAYWEDGAMAYLKRYHHIQYLENQQRLDIINRAVGEHIAAFNKEVAT